MADYVWGNPYEDQDQSPSGASILDVAKEATSGAIDLPAQAASVGQYSASQANQPLTATIMRGASEILHGAADALRGTETTGGKQARDAAFIPEGDQSSISDAPISSLAMKGAGMAPLLGVMMAFPEGAIGEGLAGGAMQGAQVIDNAMQATNKLSDDDLKAQSPTYAHFRETMSETQARSELAKVQVSGKDLAVAGVIGALGMGAGARVLKGTGAGAGEGMLKGSAIGAAEAGAGMGSGAADVDYALQQANIATGMGGQNGQAPTETNWHHVIMSGFEGMLSGGMLGGSLGALHGKLRSGAEEASGDATGDRANKSVGAIPDSDVANTPHTVSGGFATGVAPQPVGAHTRAPDTPVEYPKEGVTSAGKAPVQTDAVPADVQAAIGNVAAPKTPETAPVAAPVGPATPLPPEAQQAMERQQAQPQPAPVATPTPTGLDTGQNVPEAPKTLAIQQQAAEDGKRSVVMYPTGTTPLPRPKGWQTFKNDRGVIHYDPKQLKWKDISEASKAGKENELLGLGPVSKPEVDARVAQGETPVGVTERTPDGTEVKAAAGTTETAPEQARALEATKTEPENTVQVESPAKVLADRSAANDIERTRATYDRLQAEAREKVADPSLSHEERAYYQDRLDTDTSYQKWKSDLASMTPEEQKAYANGVLSKIKRVMQRHAGEILSPTEAKTEPKSGRVLEDVRPEAVAKGKQIAEEVRARQIAAEATLKEPEAPKGKNRTTSEVAARAKEIGRAHV